MPVERLWATRRAVPGVAAALLIAVIAIACASGESLRPVPTPGPAQPTPAPRPISIPADERSHEDRLEWWYYNGHLTAEGGEEFGFHFVIFQSLDDDGAPVYAAQFGLTDVDADEHLLDSRLTAGDAEVSSDDLFGLRVRDWSLDLGPDSHSIRGSIDDRVGLELDLALDPLQEPVRHAGIGWFATPTGWSYYYSWPDMPATGKLTVGGREYSVTGTGWFDHQWGDFFALGAPGGWQWMGLHLGEGQTLMVAEIRNLDGAVEAVFGTWADGPGRTRSLTEADGIRIEVLDTWHSPETGADYPSRWRLAVDGLNLDVEIEPVVAAQEVDEGVPEAAIYWEGKVRVDGAYRGKQIQQPGYVELTGYVNPASIPWRETP